MFFCLLHQLPAQINGFKTHIILKGHKGESMVLSISVNEGMVPKCNAYESITLFSVCRESMARNEQKLVQLLT